VYESQLSISTRFGSTAIAHFMLEAVEAQKKAAELSLLTLVTAHTASQL
jgi:hypothetical protein